MKTERIYIYLRNENVDVWRPVNAIPLGNNIFRIPEETIVPEDEDWEFTPGQTVRCRDQNLSEGQVLVAFETAD
jgi:hypothetical protein